MTKTIYHESCMAATSEVEQTESGFNVERVFVNLSFTSRRTLVPVSDSPLHTSHFCFFACSVRKWKYKSLQSHMSGPPPNTELKILAGLPVITGRHIYLKGVVRPPSSPPSALHATAKHRLDSFTCDIRVSAFQSLVGCL